MKVGFTGTRLGLTPAQLSAVQRELLTLRQRGATEFHHGDCLGADAMAAASARLRGFFVVSHPPVDQGMRAYSPADEYRRPAPYLLRNHNIVDDTDELIACPEGMAERQRSGTWSTVRYARRLGRPITIIYPDHSVVRE